MSTRQIKTITCHDVYNYGATLQAYALMKYLQNEGHDVEIIDYKPEYLANNNSYYLWRISSKWNKNLITRFVYFCIKVPLRYFSIYKGKSAYDTFKRKRLSITRIRYKNNSDLKFKMLDADAFIAGSDQIWNTVFQNGRDPAFYLDFVPNGQIKVSYAASFATKEIVPEYREFVKKSIDKFDYISVREQQGINILKSIGIDRATIVVDPVFLLSQYDWEKIAVPLKKSKKKYLLLYEIERSQVIEKCAKILAKENDLLIYAVSCYSPTPYADRDYFNKCGPETYVALIKNAEMILSNSFHATAFSIIFEKTFFTFNLIKHDINSRMADLLDSCGIKERLINSELELNDLKKVQIDYVRVRERINIHIRDSKLFIKNALLQIR